MARQKEFDREDVLQKAMAIFWHQGYGATSIQDLVDTMGINRGSLYATFGGKHQLYLAVLDYYNQKNVQTPLSQLANGSSALASFRALLWDFTQESEIDLERKGCLMTNTAVELGPHDTECRQRVLANYKLIEELFYQTLLRAQVQGEIGPGRDLRTLAQYFMTGLQGLRVLAKVDPDPTKLQSILQVMLSVL